MLMYIVASLMVAGFSSMIIQVMEGLGLVICVILP